MLTFSDLSYGLESAQVNRSKNAESPLGNLEIQYIRSYLLYKHVIMENILICLCLYYKHHVIGQIVTLLTE